MKKVCVLVAVFTLLVSGMALAGQYGPAQPGLKGGQWSLGPGVFSYSGEWEDDVDARQIMGYAQLGYGITDNWEIYAQAGAADLKIEGIVGSDTDFDDGYQPFGGLGIRALLADRKPVGLGIFAQGLVFGGYEDDIDGTNIEFDPSYEISGGLALQTVIEGATLYGGPFLYVREGDVKVEVAGLSDTDSFEEQGNFGGFLGIRWPLKSGINIELEGQVRTKASVGGSIQFVF